MCCENRTHALTCDDPQGHKLPRPVRSAFGWQWFDVIIVGDILVLGAIDLE